MGGGGCQKEVNPPKKSATLVSMVVGGGGSQRVVNLTKTSATGSFSGVVVASERSYPQK